MKERIISSLIVIATGIVVTMFNVSYANNILENKDDKAELAGKLDKAEYEKDQKSRWANHDKVHALEFTFIKESNDKTNWLYENEISKGNYSIPPLNNKQ